METSRISVSVIIPCYNSQYTLLRAVESVINQTVLPKEIIIVDDASTEKEVSKVLQHIKVLYETVTNIVIINLTQNMGPGEARNIGWDCASQEYIAFLDADDSWHPQKLELQYTWMNANKHVVLSGHKCSVLIQNPISPTNYNKLTNSVVTKIRLFHTNCFQTPSVMVKRNIHYRFPRNKYYAEDYFLWLSIIVDGNVCVAFKEPLAFLHKNPYGDSGLSRNLYKMECGELVAYTILYKNKKINLAFYLWIVLYSFCKYIRRNIIVYKSNILKGK